MYRIMKNIGNDSYVFVTEPITVKNIRTETILERETINEIEDYLAKLIKNVPMRDLIVVTVKDYNLDIIFNGNDDTGYKPNDAVVL